MRRGSALLPQVTVIDRKKAQSIEIILRHIKMEHARVLRCVRTCASAGLRMPLRTCAHLLACAHTACMHRAHPPALCAARAAACRTRERRPPAPSHVVPICQNLGHKESAS